MKKFLMGILLIIVITVIAVVLHNTNASAVKTLEENNDSSSSESADADVVITDSYFIQSTNDVYLNIDNYVGKTIKIEGLVYEYEDYSGVHHHAVVRNSPGCCGNDGLAGLDMEYDNYPELETWVEVIGTIKAETFDTQRIPVIEVTSMTQKPAGKTFVTN